METYIVTANYNGEKFLEKYFNSIFNQSYTNFGIIFVDNSSNDNSVSFIQKIYPKEVKNKKIEILKNNENYGFAKANNQGIDKAFEDPECKYIICLNNDTEINKDFLEKLVLTAEKYPNTGSIQSKMIWGQNTSLINSVGIEYSIYGINISRGAYKNVNDYNREEEIFGPCAGACLYKKESLKDIAIDGMYFDEDFFAYFEDTDLALRLRWAGWTCWYSPDATVIHFTGGTSKNIDGFTVYHHWRNSVWTMVKNLPKNFIIKHIILILIFEVIQIILCLTRKEHIIIKSKWDSYKNIGKFRKKHVKIPKKIHFNDLKRWFVLRWKS